MKRMIFALVISLLISLTIEDEFDDLLNQVKDLDKDKILDSLANEKVLADLFYEQLIKDQLMNSLDKSMEKLKESEFYTGDNMQMIDKLIKDIKEMKVSLDLSKFTEIIENFKLLAGNIKPEDKEKIDQMFSLVEMLLKNIYNKTADKIKESEENKNIREKFEEEWNKRFEEEMKNEESKQKNEKEEKEKSQKLEKIQSEEDQSKVLNTVVYTFLFLVLVLAVFLILCIFISRRRIKNRDIEYVTQNNEEYSQSL